jgi:uncharacterized protein (TIGR03086 family)
VALQLRIVEAVVHGWDLARAIGRRADFPEEIVQQALQFTRAQLGRLGSTQGGRGPFAPPEAVADDAPTSDRLAALLGRRVSSVGRQGNPAPEESSGA